MYLLLLLCGCFRQICSKFYISRKIQLPVTLDTNTKSHARNPLKIFSFVLFAGYAKSGDPRIKSQNYLIQIYATLCTVRRSLSKIFCQNI